MSTPTLDDVFLTLTERSGDKTPPVDEIADTPTESDITATESDLNGKAVDRFSEVVVGTDDTFADVTDIPPSRSERARVH